MAQKTLHLQFVTPARTLFEKEVERVIIPTTSGQITVLPHHAPLVSVLAPGELLVKTAKEEFPVVVSGGVLDMFNNTLVILADSAEHPEEIDVGAAAKHAEELAKEIKTQVGMDLTTYTILKRRLEREMARVEFARKWKK
jgi:F-type H+-transporting ATPase subunit epsilon